MKYTYVVLPDDEANQQTLDSDKLHPCLIFQNSKMPRNTLREKAVQAACDAVRRYDGYFERAKYVREKFDKEEAGYWACFTQHDAGADASVSFSFLSDNVLKWCVGNCRFVLWQATSTT